MSLFLFVPIALVFVGAFLGVHYGIFLFLLHFFPFLTAHKPLLGWLLFFLSISFFVSSVLAHFLDTAFARALYFASGVWMGTMLNILLAMVATGILVVVSRLAGVSLDGSMLAGVCLAMALAVSGYGVWHALHPKMQEITVTIPHLPERWRGQKIVQISDVHLGHVYRADFLQKVVERINQTQPKIVVITGDLFDGMDGDLETLTKPLDALDAKLGVLFVGGNHETYLGTAKTLEILTKTKVRILRNEVLDEEGLSFVGIAYPERSESTSIVQSLTVLQPSYAGKPTVLLYHAPAHIEEVAQMGINLQLSGHTHQGQQFPFQWVTHFVHHGFDYGLYTIGEYSLYVTSGVGTWGPTMRLGTQSEIVIITLQ